FNEFSGNIATALVCLATNRTYNFSKIIFDGMMRNVKSKGKFQMYPRRITRGTIQISQSKVPSPGADETAFPTGDARYEEDFLTVTSLDAGQDKENIAKTSTMPISWWCDKRADKKSDSTDGMANILGTLGAENILASGGLSVATPTTRVTRSSRGVVIKSSSLIFVNIPSISKKDKGKGKMREPEQPSKEKVLKQISAQLARDLKAKELEMMIAELDRSNEIVAKNLAQIKKYQAQQNKPARKTERRDCYMSILRNNAGWKAKDFKRMTFEQIEQKFILVWEKMQDFVPMNSKLESERLKRPGIQLGKESFKKLKTAEASGTEPTQKQQFEEPKELSEVELKKMMEMVPVGELYIKALHVKYPIIDWEIYSEDQRKYWKIISVGNHTEVYQIFDDMLKKFDREDLDRL
nr:synaptobrevin, longin-like domain protein [Tanacetum cinerariifolium]